MLMPFLNEKQIELILLRNIDLIGKDFYIVGNQFSINNCFFDFLCEDKEKNLIIIELKLTAGTNAIKQILGYYKELKGSEKFKERSIRLLIACYNIKNAAKKMAKEFGVEVKILQQEKLLKKRSLRFYELPEDVKWILHILRSTDDYWTVEEINETTQIYGPRIQRALNFLSCCTDLKKKVNSDGEEEYTIPKNFYIEGFKLIYL